MLRVTKPASCLDLNVAGDMHKVYLFNLVDKRCLVIFIKKASITNLFKLMQKGNTFNTTKPVCPVFNEDFDYRTEKCL